MRVFRLKSIHIDASTACQLRCPVCPTATGAARPMLGTGFLSFSNFRRVVDENPAIRHIELGNYGEILLNPQLERILEYGYHRGVTLTARTGVNLNNVREGLLDALVRYRLGAMTCSIDGASQETYEKYRVRGHFDTVISNLRELTRLKTEYGSPFPELTWQFIVFGHNEHEIDLARSMATELGMDFKLKLNWASDLSPVSDRDRVRDEIGAADRQEYLEKHGSDYAQGLCHNLWESPQFNWDGKSLGCCRNFWGEFGGNLFVDGLSACVNGERMRYARRMLTGKRPPRDDIPCTTCSIYEAMVERQTWLEKPRKVTGRRLARAMMRRLRSHVSRTSIAPPGNGQPA